MARSRRDAPPRALADGKMLAKCVPSASDSGKISLWCVFGLPAMASISLRCVFGGEGSSRGEIMPRCVFGRRSVAAFSLHAFPKGPRTGKAPLPGNISPPCIRNEPASARYSRHASEKRRKQPSENTPREDLAMKGPLSLCVPLRSCTARRSCHSWVLRLSALIFLGWGGGGARGSRTAPPLCAGGAAVSRARPQAASSCPQPCCRVRDATELVVACRLPQKTWRCDGVSLTCRCSAVLF